jgi:hypothetical protein
VAAADNGDGAYGNVLLYADYPDPDIVRPNDDVDADSIHFAQTSPMQPSATQSSTFRNSIIRAVFTADPAALAHNDTVDLYFNAEGMITPMDQTKQGASVSPQEHSACNGLASQFPYPRTGNARGGESVRELSENW